MCMVRILFSYKNEHNFLYLMHIFVSIFSTLNMNSVSNCGTDELMQNTYQRHL